MQIVEIAFFVLILALTLQGLINLALSLYAWEDPERILENASPKKFQKPQKTFTILVPARHEEAVIGDTIRKISQMNYPKSMYEVLVICDNGDIGTLEAAKRVVVNHAISNLRVVAYADKPISKPHGLNVGLKLAKYEIVTIFDAEDEVHHDILNIANTLYIEKNADIVQAGVQLMNYNSNWFSVHNVLEYYFWFKSRMHFHAKVGMVPLGGNSVFFKTRDVLEIDGWDEACLTEDADIGIKLSSAGKKVVVTYDPSHITKEETPDSVKSFIKQRTRWNQGFLQILKKQNWRQYDTFGKRVFCVYVLAFPLVQALLLFLTPFVVYIGLTAGLPFILSFVSFMPLLIIILQLMVYLVGFYEFSREQKLKINPVWYLNLVVTFLPYQFLLGYSAIRASIREIQGKSNWEKTSHSGLHRKTPLEAKL